MAPVSTLPQSMDCSVELPPSPGADEREQIARSQAGDVEAFNRLVEHYQQRVYTLCFRLLGDADADDATQEGRCQVVGGVRGGSETQGR